MFGSAWTENIIVRIAARLAIFALRRWMTTEPIRVEFHLGPHPLLVGALRGTVQFQAAQAGFEPETGAAIAKASEDVCRETLSHLSNVEDGLNVILETFADRMEVSILHHGESAPAIGVERFTSPNPLPPASGISGLELVSRMDRVMYSMENGQSRTTLVMFLKAQK